jgi:hypothetical protein
MFSKSSLLLLLASAGIVVKQGQGQHVVGEHYTLLAGGVCRGPGGVNDKINHMSAVEHTHTMCEQACDARREMDENGAHCKGYSYCSTCNSGECILFGPKLDGSCSDPSGDSQAACLALGSCDAPNTATKEGECGACEGKPTAREDSACESLSGTWKKGTWTSAGATWSDAETPWTGDSQSSTFIAGTSDELSSDYSCYDIVIDDHLAQCGKDGEADDCAVAFEGLEEDGDRVAENCPEGCTYTAKPRGPKNPPVAHAPDIKLPGWDPAQSGACRGGADFTGKVNGKYTNTAGADGGTPTQQECAELCLADKNCVGYAHSTAWCLAYGPDVHKGPGTEDGGLWTSDNHEEVVITGTKVNIAYICVTGPPRVTAVAESESADAESESKGDAESKDKDGQSVTEVLSGGPALSTSIAIAFSFMAFVAAM